MLTPPRRWFAFRLRTLLVVVVLLALPLAWVAYSLNWIRERWVERRRQGFYQSFFIDYGGTPVPWTLAVFREDGVAEIFLVGETSKRSDRVQQLFPEARVKIARSAHQP
jgi:hypothetical protein